jgi:Na+:H+ antiporter, NhaA family
MEILKNNSNGLQPILKFVKKSSFSSLLLFFSAFAALILANTPANVFIEAFLYKKIGFTIGNFELYKNTQLWINDGLMSIFFFVIGLELKREIIAGQLSNVKNIIMPMVAAIGGMVLPALIYYLFNNQGSGESLNGWGIPMATDIAFALGVLYLLGPKVPIQLKVFLTALAIIDDIGAVLVVAVFYTSEISVFYLIVALVFLGILFLLSKLGVRDVLVFAVIGIIGVWLPFLLSGIHATIAAVLVAFAIPATRAIDKKQYLEDLNQLMSQFKMAKKSEKEIFLLSPKEENIIGEIQRISLESISPLQRLERNMHGLVLFVVMPIFALANAGVEIDSDWAEMISSPVSLGIIVGLMVGKLIGIFGLSMLGLKLGWYKMPENLNTQMILGASFLAAIGFTMALFINSLAFENYVYMEQAKMGILLASFLSGWLGYFFIKKAIAHR